MSASSLKDKAANGLPKVEQAKKVGHAIAEKAKAAGATVSCWDTPATASGADPREGH